MLAAAALALGSSYAVANPPHFDISAQDFRQQWNEVVAQVAHGGGAHVTSALQLGGLGAAPADALASPGGWRARCGNGDVMTFSADTPQQTFALLRIDSAAVGLYAGPQRIAPCVLWSMKILQPALTQQQVEALAVQLLRGANAANSQSEARAAGVIYHLSSDAQGGLHFSAQAGGAP